MPVSSQIPQPWLDFLRELDDLVTVETYLVCMGGFVVSLCYGLDRPTADIDVSEVLPGDSLSLMAQALRGGTLHNKYGIYLDRVTVAPIPENYDERLIEMFSGTFKKLRIMTLDPYDLALSKLGRNTEKDRDDVFYLAKTIPLDLDILVERYETELRPILMGAAEREDLTLRLWIRAINERRSKS